MMLYFPAPSIPLPIRKILNKILNVFEQCADTWKMTFNTDKCQIVQFPKQDHNNFYVTYKLYGKPLAIVISFKYFGFFLSDNFSWDLYIDTIISKACQRLGMLKHVFSIAPMRVRRVAYLTLCRPILEYASEVWGPHLVHQITSLKSRER